MEVDVLTDSEAVAAMRAAEQTERQVRAQLDAWLHAGGLGSDVVAHRVTFRAPDRCSAWVSGPRMPLDRGFIVSWSEVPGPERAQITLTNRGESRVFLRLRGTDVETVVRAAIATGKIPRGALPLKPTAP